MVFMRSSNVASFTANSRYPSGGAAMQETYAHMCAHVMLASKKALHRTLPSRDRLCLGRANPRNRAGYMKSAARTL